MNRTLSSLVLALALVAFGVAQEPPGCNTRTTHKKHLLTASGVKKRKVLDLRKRKPKPDIQTEGDRSIPVIASPIYLPQNPGGAATMTASGGYIYILIGQRLYKVSEKTMKTVDMAVLGRTEPVATDAKPSKRRRKVVAENDEDTPRKSRSRSSD